MKKKLLELELNEVDNRVKPFSEKDYILRAWFDFEKGEVFNCVIEKNITKGELADSLESLIKLLRKHDKEEKCLNLKEN
jgi:hypothetical protein